MKTRLTCMAACIATALIFLTVSETRAAFIVNGGFESGFSSWTVVNEVASDGTFFLQTGVTSPSAGDLVPAPPGGLTAAMSDAQGPGSHVLYQNIVIPAAMPTAILVFDVFVGNRATEFRTPNTLSFSTPTLNQQARVDILLGGSDPFSLAPADLLLNAYRTNVGDPLISGYTHHAIDITAIVNANVGAPLRIRFAEVDNIFTFQFGIDNVDIVPEPSSAILALTGMVGLIGLRRRVR